jgi:thymidylate synthase (FAD)
MSVKLITATPDGEKIMTYTARVSNSQNQANNNIIRLLRYCLRNGHVSVFETAYMTVEINTTISIASQLLRHRSFTFQQFSQRYANVNDLGTITIPDLRRQDTKNRQNSIDDIEDSKKQYFQDKIRSHFHSSIELYNEMIDAGIAKECARFVLPLSSPTKLYMTGNCRSWIHYLQSRTHESTQKEHRNIAIQIKEIFKDVYPTIYELL